MTLGRGAWHSEQNASETEPMRFIQMWIMPSERGLEPGVEQKVFTTEDRTDTLLKVISGDGGDAVLVHQDAHVFVSRLTPAATVTHEIARGRGVYLYVIEGRCVAVNGERMETGAAAQIRGESSIEITASAASELILVDVAARPVTLHSSTLTGNGRATGSTNGERPRSSKRSIRNRSDVFDDLGGALEHQVGRDARDRRAPHHAVAARARDRRAVDLGAVTEHERARERQVVGGVLDRRGPDLLRCRGPSVGGTRRCRPALHPAEVGPVDRPAGARFLVGVRHAPQEAALLGSPVDAGAMSNAIAVVSACSASLASVTTTWWRAYPTHARAPAAFATACIAGRPSAMPSASRSCPPRSRRR